MGCDIHTAVEWQDDNGIWRFDFKERFPCEYYDPEKITEVKYYEANDDEDASSHTWNAKFIREPARARNYYLFAILAGVRNDEDIVPIVEPRGVPEDRSPEWQEIVDHWGPDLHTPSWLTLAELEGHNWHAMQTYSGLISSEDWDDFVANGEPRSWCRWTSAPKMDRTTFEQARSLVHAGVVTLQRNVYVRATWQLPLSHYCKSFLEKDLPIMRELANSRTGEDPNRVRMVFGFDN